MSFASDQTSFSDPNFFFPCVVNISAVRHVERYQISTLIRLIGASLEILFKKKNDVCDSKYEKNGANERIQNLKKMGIF